MVAFLAVLNVVIAFVASLAFGAWLVRRYPPLGWSTFGVGMACFVGAQILHIPFNELWLEPAIAPAPLIPQALVFGLSAGLFEELARYVVIRYARRERTGPHALMFGAGHAGVESTIFVGLPGLFALMQFAAVARYGIENLTPDPAIQGAVRASLALADAEPWRAVIPGFERLLAIPFHVAATCLVMLAVERKQPLYLVLAIVWHALVDAVVVWLKVTHGMVWVELLLVAVSPLNVAAIVLVLRKLPRLVPPPPNPRPETEGEPLELHAATKSFVTRKNTVVALDGVTFTLRRGERACLLGPNGAGKTTAIRLFTGALTPTHGWAFLLGHALLDPGFLAAKRKVGIVPQQPGMYETMSVGAYLELVRVLYQAKSYEGLAERLGLSELLERPMNVLSGGQQRRLCLAAALMSEPELLILDEPSAGLDPIAARAMNASLKEASRERTTLLCTHNLDEAEDLCDSVVILWRGRVIVHERIADLRGKAQARLALRAAQGADRLREILSERGHDPRLEEDGALSIALEGGERGAPELLRTLLGDGIDVFECRIVRPTLEDLFHHYVEREEAAR